MQKVHNGSLPFIEVRVATEGTHKKAYIKGYAVTKDTPHVYKYVKKQDGSVLSFRSLFTKEAIDDIGRQLSYKRIFADENHKTAAHINAHTIIRRLRERGLSPDVQDELSSLEANLTLDELPLFKLSSFNLTDDGIEVEIESNPHYADVDDSHEKYYYAIIGSIEEGFYKGFSLNFSTRDMVNENGLEKINGVDIYGISIIPDPALGASSPITEVMVRSLMEVRSEQMEKKPEELEKFISELVEKRLTEERQKEAAQTEQLRAKRELEALEKEREVYKQEVQALKEKLQASRPPSNASKGNVAGDAPPAQFDEKKLSEHIANLTYKELLQLQAEFGSRLPPITIGTSPASNKHDPSHNLVAMPVESSMAERFQQLKMSEKNDLVFESIKK